MDDFSRLPRTIARYRWSILAVLAAVLVAPAESLWAQDPPASAPRKGPSLLSPGVTLPLANAKRGRRLFAQKGCVVCHSVNKVGGGSAPNLDVATGFPYGSPFDFAARMWRGAKAMIALQEADLGYVIELNGNELADIAAFARSPDEQRRFSEEDIPVSVKRMMKARNL